MDRKSPETPTFNLNPIHVIEHDDLPTIIGEDGEVTYPFGEKNSLAFASVNDARRWKKNVSAKTSKKHSYETQVQIIKEFWIAMTGLLTFVGTLLFLLCFFGDVTYKDFPPDIMLVSGGSFALYGALLATTPIMIKSMRTAMERSRAESTYQVLNLDHPLFIKNELLARYGGIILDLQNNPANLEANSDRSEDVHTSPAAIETGESTRRMLNEYEEYLGAARRIAGLWPDADQPTRDAILADMNRKTEKLRTACANYQADADQIATINREKQDYLDQKHTEAEAILAEAKAVEAAEEYKRIRAQYGF